MKSFLGSLHNDDGLSAPYFICADLCAGLCADLFFRAETVLSVLDRDCIPAQNFMNFGSASF